MIKGVLRGKLTYVKQVFFAPHQALSCVVVAGMHKDVELSFSLTPSALTQAYHQVSISISVPAPENPEDQALTTYIADAMQLLDLAALTTPTTLTAELLPGHTKYAEVAIGIIPNSTVGIDGRNSAMAVVKFKQNTLCTQLADAAEDNLHRSVEQPR